MAVDEHSRHQLHTKLEQVLGPNEASTLMAHLPPVGWGDVATKRDLDHLSAQNLREHEHLRSNIDQLRDEMGRLRGEVDTKFATKLELEAMKKELLAALHKEISSTTRTFIVAMSMLNLTLAGTAFGAAHLT